MQTYQTEWEKDFDEKFVVKDDDLWSFKEDTSVGQVRYFIRSLLQAREEWLREQVKGIKKEGDGAFGVNGGQDELISRWSVLSLIKK